MLLLLSNTAAPPYQSRLQALMSDSVNLHRQSTLPLSNLHSEARSIATASAQTRLCPSPSTGLDCALSNMLRAARSIAAARIPPAPVDIRRQSNAAALVKHCCAAISIAAASSHVRLCQSPSTEHAAVLQTELCGQLHRHSKSAQPQLYPSPSTGPDTVLPKTCSAPPNTPRLQQPTRWTTLSEYSWASPTQPSQGVPKTR